MKGIKTNGPFLSSLIYEKFNPASVHEIRNSEANNSIILTSSSWKRRKFQFLCERNQDYKAVVSSGLSAIICCLRYLEKLYFTVLVPAGSV